MSNTPLPPGPPNRTSAGIAGETPGTARQTSGLPRTPEPTESTGEGECFTVNDLARRIAKGIIDPAFNRPGSEWHERYRELNRAAGVIVGWSLANSDFVSTVEALTFEVERCFDPGERLGSGARFMRKLRERIAAIAVEMGL